MKFIRTENGIYEREKVEIVLNKGSVNKPNIPPIEKIRFWIDSSNYYEETIIAEADTIEELCDCFVVVGKKHIVWDKDQLKGLTFGQVKFAFANEDFEIYGAIWTSKGLIYVAKMNENGDLVLI